MPRSRRQPRRNVALKTAKPAADQLELSIAAPRQPDSAQLIRILAQAARAAAASVGFRRGSLSVAVVGARRMAEIHEEFSGVPGATDVLTFDLGGDVRHGVLDGEIVVCAPIARQAALARTGPRGAAAFPRQVQRELALYVVHGILHLAGHDDHSPAGFAAMHAAEDQILTTLGLGPVFGGPVKPKAPAARPRRRRRSV